jgi:hypothetical protein
LDSLRAQRYLDRACRLGAIRVCGDAAVAGQQEERGTPERLIALPSRWHTAPEVQTSPRVLGMKINSAAAVMWLALAMCLASADARAQPEVVATELTRAKVLLDLSRAELTAEQFALLSRRLAAARTAYVELATVARATQAAAAVAEGGTAAASAKATATGGRASLGSAAQLLPLLLMVWPSTAHAPGVKQETPEVQAARAKLDEKLKELAEAARQVESERQAAAARVPKPTLERCLQACEGGPEAREAFCRALPDQTPQQREKRRLCWAAVQESVEFCKNTCRAILGN